MSFGQQMVGHRANDTNKLGHYEDLPRRKQPDGFIRELRYDAFYCNITHVGKVTSCCAPPIWKSFGEIQLSKKMYVGNLSFEATEEDVRDLFAPYGKVESVNMAMDRLSGKFRGFCFVEMENNEANAAMTALDNYQMDGRTLKVNEARPREDRGGGSRSGGGFRSGGSNRSGGSSNRGGYKRSG